MFCQPAVRSLPSATCKLDSDGAGEEESKSRPVGYLPAFDVREQLKRHGGRQITTVEMPRILCCVNKQVDEVTPLSLSCFHSLVTTVAFR